MRKTAHGFTLIELSIVLVIIGLIVGGVLVGQSLIAAAGVRATIAQIEKYNTATNTFRGKYGALPGDLNAAAATQFGFTPRGCCAGEGDGNGIIEGVDAPGAYGTNWGGFETTGETTMFWVDLSTANGLNVNLVDGGFNTALPDTPPGGNITGAGIDAYLPQAKLGGGNYVYVWSYSTWNGSGWSSSGINYYGISAISQLAGGGTVTSTPGLTVQQAYSIDKKVDDGMPQSGNVTAQYLSNLFEWSGVGDTSAVTGSPTTCYDNGGVTGTQQYSLEINGGAGVNCGVSFRFQ